MASIWRCLANREPPRRMPLSGRGLQGCPVGLGADGDGLAVGGLLLFDDQVRPVAATMYQAACGRIFIMGAPGEWITSRSDYLPT